MASDEWKDALTAAASVSIPFYSGIPRRLNTLGSEFMVPTFTIYQALCEYLETIDRITDAIECFRKMVGLGQQRNTHVEQARWVCGERSRIVCRCHRGDHRMPDFRRRCSRKLEDFGDTAMGTERCDEVISQYSAALSLDPATPQNLLIKRNKAYLAKGLWKDALDDANAVRLLCLVQARS